MSNATFRRQDEEARAARLDALKQAQAFLIFMRQTISADEITAHVKERFDDLGGETIDADLASLERLIAAGDLSRECEIAMLKANLDAARRGLPPAFELTRMPVSAATHRAAIRDRQLLSEKKARLWQEATIATAQDMEHHLRMQRAQQDAKARKDGAPTPQTPPPGPVEKPAAATVETKPPAGPPAQGAAATAA